MPEEEIQDANQGNVWNADGSLPRDMDPDREVSSNSQKPFLGQTEDSSAAEPLNTESESEDEFEETGEAEAEESAEEESEEQLPFHTHPRWKEMVQGSKEKETTISELQAQLEQANEMAQFYANQYNDAVGLAQAKKTTEPPTTASPTETQASQVQISEDPNQWETAKDYANWVKAHTQKAQEGHYEQVIKPSLLRQANQLGALMEWVIRALKPDYDDVVKGTYGDIWDLDPQGKAVGVKNQALFNYFDAQLLPHVAMYEHGLRKSAATRIKQGVQDATKKNLQKLGAKPRGPTKPGTTTAATARKDFWNSQEAWTKRPSDKQLKESGLL